MKVSHLFIFLGNLAIFISAIFTLASFDTYLISYSIICGSSAIAYAVNKKSSN